MTFESPPILSVCLRGVAPVITPVNPIGAAKGTEKSGQGHDINRDFVRFVTAEARVVRDVFERVRPDFVLSLHEGPQEGTFVFANELVDPALATALCDALAAGGTLLAEKDYFGLPLRPRGLSSASPASRAVWRVWALALRSKARRASARTWTSSLRSERFS